MRAGSGPGSDSCATGSSTPGSRLHCCFFLIAGRIALSFTSVKVKIHIYISAYGGRLQSLAEQLVHACFELISSIGVKNLLYVLEMCLALMAFVRNTNEILNEECDFLDVVCWMVFFLPRFSFDFATAQNFYANHPITFILDDDMYCISIDFYFDTDLISTLCQRQSSLAAQTDFNFQSQNTCVFQIYGH